MEQNVKYLPKYTPGNERLACVKAAHVVKNTSEH